MTSIAITNYARQLLLQLQQLIETLSPNEYSAEFALLNNASIGRHVRHVIEVFVELQHGYQDGIVSYDQRKRNKLLENNPIAAIEQLVLLSQTIDMADKNLQLAVGLDPKQEVCYVNSNYLRELLYNVEHTLHHMAIIRIAVENCTDKKVSATFGIAEATLRHEQICAQ